MWAPHPVLFAWFASVLWKFRLSVSVLVMVNARLTSWYRGSIKPLELGRVSFMARWFLADPRCWRQAGWLRVWRRPGSLIGLKSGRTRRPLNTFGWGTGASLRFSSWLEIFIKKTFCSGGVTPGPESKPREFVKNTSAFIINEKNSRAGRGSPDEDQRNLKEPLRSASVQIGNKTFALFFSALHFVC